MKKIFYMFATALLFQGALFASEINGKTSLQGETFNFELAGQKNWDYDIKRVTEKNQAKVQLTIKSADENTIQQIKTAENPFVKLIQVKPQIDGKTIIEFTLNDGDVESFDYLTDQPSKLIVDFYQADPVDSDLKTPKKPKKVEAKKIAAKNAKGASKIDKKTDRQPADVDILRIDEPGGIETSVIARSGLYDGGDAQFSRFSMRENEYKEEAVIRSQSNYYLKFPILESEFSFWKKMKEDRLPLHRPRQLRWRTNPAIALAARVELEEEKKLRQRHQQ